MLNINKKQNRDVWEVKEIGNFKIGNIIVIVRVKNSHLYFEILSGKFGQKYF